MVHNICHIICLRLFTAFLNLSLGFIAFADKAYPENWALLYKALSTLATKKMKSSQGKMYFFFNLNKKFLSTFDSVPKVNEFLSNILSISHTLLKHKRY